MSMIRLNNGAEYPADWCGAAQRRMSANILRAGCMAELAAAFADPANTARITFETGLETITYEGYTRLAAIAEGGWSEGATLVTLIKEADA